MQKARASLPEVPAGRPLREYLRMMIEAGVREHRVDPALHRVFAEELPRSSRLQARKGTTDPAVDAQGEVDSRGAATTKLMDQRGATRPGGSSSRLMPASEERGRRGGRG